MTLLHQAALKAVEALKDATRGYDAMNWNRSKLDAAITAIESALQHQEVPREPTHEQMMAGYAVACRFKVYESQAFKLAEEMYRAMSAASPSTTRQQEVGSGPYRTSAGDTLLGIAQRELGDGERWPEIKRLNMNAFDPESDGWSRPRAGTLLTLPAAPSTPENADGGPHG